MINKQEAKNHLDYHLPYSNLDIGSAISDGFDTWKKEAGSYIGLVLILIGISFGLAIIPIIGQIASGLIITPAMGLGAYLYTHKVVHSQQRQFGDFFKGFDYIGPLIVAGLILFAFAIVLVAPVGIAAFVFTDIGMAPTDLFQSTWAIIAAVLFGLLGIYASMLILFYQHFIGFFNLDGWDAIKYSAKYGHKNWIYLFGFMILVGLISAIGIIGFIIGVFVTYSMVFPMSYHAFRQMTNLDEFLFDGDNSGSKPLDHLTMNY